MKKLIVFFLFLTLFSLPLWALCVQGAPYNCPSYMAVACHPDGVYTTSDIHAKWALVIVYGANGRELDQQGVSCTDDGRLDPCLYENCFPAPTLGSHNPSNDQGK